MPACPTPSQSAASANAPPDVEFVRLHITPLDADLVNLVLPASLRSLSRNISFHTIQTFPEKRYGFVDLPRMDADRLKRKLNGSLLKGSKIHINDARPEERIEPMGDAARPEKKRKQGEDASEGSKRHRRDPNVLEGVTLKDRKVKRGWTESANAKRKGHKGKDKETQKRQRSRYTDQDECLLKVKLPPNAMGNLPKEAVSKNNKSRGKSREVTVHEFERTTKFPSFLKLSAPDNGGKPAAGFVDGRGWVDEDGNVVEAVSIRAPPTPKAIKPSATAAEEEDNQDNDTSSSSTTSDEQSDDDTSSSGTSSEGEPEEDEQSAVGKSAAQVPGKRSASVTGDAQDRLPKAAEQATPSAAVEHANSGSPMPGSSKSLNIKIPEPETPSAAKVHPLEALYKRAQPGSDATNTLSQPEPFSFFAGESDDEETTGAAEAEKRASQSGMAAPMTPFAQQDFERRSVRSSAPTPDTAHPSRVFWDSRKEEDEDGDGDGDGEADGDEAQDSRPDQSEFQTWFWENRRELNRSWMLRKKTAAKEKRHRENKARASKTI